MFELDELDEELWLDIEVGELDELVRLATVDELELEELVKLASVDELEELRLEELLLF